MNNIPTKEEIQELLCKAFTISNLNQSEMEKKQTLHKQTFAKFCMGHQTKGQTHSFVKKQNSKSF